MHKSSTLVHKLRLVQRLTWTIRVCCTLAVLLIAGTIIHLTRQADYYQRLSDHYRASIHYYADWVEHREWEMGLPSGKFHPACYYQQDRRP